MLYKWFIYLSYEWKASNGNALKILIFQLFQIRKEEFFTITRINSLSFLLTDLGEQLGNDEVDFYITVYLHKS